MLSGLFSAAVLLSIYFGSSQLSMWGLLCLAAGWLASGVLNVRFCHWFWGNPMVGEGSGGFIAFISGPFYFALWLLFFAVVFPLELILNGVDNLRKSRKK